MFHAEECRYLFCESCNRHSTCLHGATTTEDTHCVEQCALKLQDPQLVIQHVVSDLLALDATYCSWCSLKLGNASSVKVEWREKEALLEFLIEYRWQKLLHMLRKQKVSGKGVVPVF